jgi:hypothetical protein
MSDLPERRPFLGNGLRSDVRSILPVSSSRAQFSSSPELGYDHEIGEWQKTDRMLPFERAEVSAVK